jgi:hypothetical protein
VETIILEVKERQAVEQVLLVLILPQIPITVYQIQLLENSGTHYPIIRLYEFPDVQQVTAIKNFKNKLYLSAAYNQLLANEVGQTATGSPSLGIGEPIWNKEYKVRLTSKQTGRKIDINFKFTYGLRQE